MHGISGFENKPLTAEKVKVVLKKYFSATILQ
jgi:hypothetical protein